VLDAIRDGRLEQIFDNRESPEALAAIKEVDIQWLNSDSIHCEEKLSMRLRATEGGHGLSSARITVRLARVNADPFYVQVETDGSGEAQLVFLVDEPSLHDSSVLVQVNSHGRTATRKFHLRKLEA